MAKHQSKRGEKQSLALGKKTDVFAVGEECLYGDFGLCRICFRDQTKNVAGVKNLLGSYGYMLPYEIADAEINKTMINMKNLQ